MLNEGCIRWAVPGGIEEQDLKADINNTQGSDNERLPEYIRSGEHEPFDDGRTSPDDHRLALDEPVDAPETGQL
ncbi:MAG: hypothetical protein WD766_08175 [Gemmatimonadota bacterium]